MKNPIPQSVFQLRYQSIHQLIVLAGISLAGTATVAFGQVELFAEPDINSALLAEVAADDARLQDAGPAADPAMELLGWRMLELTLPVTGYVQDEKIGKDLDPVDEANVYSRPDAASAVLGRYRTGTPTTILDRGAWWHIETQLPVSAYFLMPQTSQQALAAEPLPLFDLEPDEPVQIADVTASGPGTEAAASQPRSGIEELPTAMPEEPTQFGSIMSQRFEGTLRKSGSFLGIRTPPHPYYLEDSDGNRLAWIDSSRLVLSGSFNDYIGTRVIVFGEMDPDVSRRDRVISARNMRHP